MPVRFIFTLLIVLAAGCKDVDVTDPRVAAAITDINATFRTEYQVPLADIGTRHFAVDRALAFSGMRQTLQKLGFTVINSEGDYYLYVTAPAPMPLDDREWQEVRRIDEPGFKDIAARHLGIKGRLAKLEPEGLVIVGRIIILEAGDGVDISITFRTEEIKPQPPESILPRREYPPPAAARIGYEKIWRTFEEEALPLVGMANRT